MPNSISKPNHHANVYCNSSTKPSWTLHLLFSSLCFFVFLFVIIFCWHPVVQCHIGCKQLEPEHWAPRDAPWKSPQAPWHWDITLRGTHVSMGCEPTSPVISTSPDSSFCGIETSPAAVMEKWSKSTSLATAFKRQLWSRKMATRAWGKMAQPLYTMLF